MVYLSQKKDLKNVLIEESNHDDYTMPPRFYLKNWKSEFYLTRLFPLDSLVERIKGLPPESTPNYVVFVQPENIGMRVIGLKKIFPHLTFEAIIQPGFIDNVMFRLNKHNANFTSYIFKLGNPSIKVE